MLVNETKKQVSAASQPLDQQTTSADDIAISVKNLTKKYRIFGHPGDRIKQALTFGRMRFHNEFIALQDVSFEIKKGEAVGIIGRNGSGKSTLLQLICGILRPTSGEVQVNGRVSALLELGAGFNHEFTGRENVYFQGAVIGLTKEKIDERFDDIAAFADIGEFIDQPVRTYSSGMFVRLAFAAAIHADPDILIVDEALSVGDISFQRKCTEKMKALRNAGVTILVVSHDLHLVERFCDRVLVLDCGRGVCDASAQEGTAFYRNLVQRQRDVEAASQDSPEVRYATGEVTLLEARIADVGGQPRNEFITGEDIVVALRYAARTPVCNVYFGCSIWAGAETRVATASMIVEQPEPFRDELQGEFEVSMVLPQIPLLPGTYSLRGGVYDERLHYAHCLWGWTGTPLGVFSIASSNRNGFVLKDDFGFFLLSSRWQIFRGDRE